ncbi:hypothetical protein PLESTF_000904900 [Pleodorina starrii]|nr:hypothetical protein PLESTM_001889900 [Pleodorina starrii]GLC69968.1 hypothetical protein PLESTF_000904900 [Pleodorina starrii]
MHGAMADAKLPKKLSDVKINPAVAATFANISIPSSSSASSLGKLAPPPAPGVPVKPGVPQQSSSNSLDLFGEPISDTQPAAQPSQQQGGAAAVGLDWDAAFGTAEPSGASTTTTAVTGGPSADPFADFAGAAPAAPAPAPAAAPSGGFDSLFGAGGGGSSSSVTTTATGASGRPPVRPPLSLDDFAELGDPSPAAAPRQRACHLSQHLPQIPSEHWRRPHLQA